MRMPGHPVDDTSITLMMRLQRFPADPQAWDEFVERYRPMIRAWCLKWQLQDSDAEDVVQDVLVKLVAAIRKFQYDPARSFRAWLKTVTQNALSDFVASHRKDPNQTAGPIDMLAESVEAKSDLEQRLEDAFDAEVLELAMHRVKHRVKAGTWDAFHLTAVEGLTGAVAASRLQIPVAHVFVAKNRVQKMLQEEARILKKKLK
jgi:RNA polymerase sigma factor (sigma-70 family)